MKINRSSAAFVISRIVFALIFAAVGLLIVVVFSPYRPMLTLVNDLIGRTALAAALLVIALIARKSSWLNKYWQVLFGLFVLVFAVSAVWVLACYLLDSIKVNINEPFGYAMLKFSEGIVVVALVVLLTRASGNSLGSVYFRKGNLQKGLIVGLIAFCVAAAGSIPVSALFFGAHDINISKIVAWLPWILVFVFANAANEEVLFRGLFLKKLEPLYGKFLSNFIIAFAFTGLHIGVTYPADQLAFLLLLFPLALVWGYITQKTESLIGSILFHAGTDIAVILGIFSNLH